MRLRGRGIGAAALAVVILCAVSSNALADGGPQGKNFGVGIVLGEPTGPTVKAFLSDVNAVQVAASWSFRHDSFIVLADYLFHFRGVIENTPDTFEAVPYVGIGGRVGVYDHNHPNKDHDHTHATLGMRVPLGATVLLTKAPLEFFLEIAPGVRLVPETDVDLDAGVGARFYF